jgi:hypothetical protein
MYRVENYILTMGMRGLRVTLEKCIEDLGWMRYVALWLVPQRTSALWEELGDREAAKRDMVGGRGMVRRLQD